jgi:ribosome hibernation promoting factor
VRTVVKGKNLDVFPADRAYAERKMGRLGRIVDEDSDAVVEFSIEHHRSAEDSHIVEASLTVHGRPIRGVASGATHRAALDTLLDKLERRVVASKEKPRGGQRKRRPVSLGAAIAPEPLESPDEEGDGPPDIVKIKRFGIEPMFEEDAVARMEELGHQFFIFVNAENERLAVLYRRRDGDYGVIEPVVGGEYSTNGRSAQPLRVQRRVDARA